VAPGGLGRALVQTPSWEGATPGGLNSLHFWTGSRSWRRRFRSRVFLTQNFPKLYDGGPKVFFLERAGMAGDSV